MLNLEAGRGFTLIELLVAMGIFALLLALGAPTMSTYLQNSKLSAATQQMYGAVQTARAEAIRRNGRVQFVLTDTPVETPNLENVLVPGVVGRNWVVRAPNGVNFDRVEAKAGSEGEASNTAPAVQFAGAGAPVAWDGTITFNGLGETVAGGAAGTSYRIDITNPTAGLCVLAGGPIRCRQIRVSQSGQITACDPAAPGGDSRAC